MCENHVKTFKEKVGQTCHQSWALASVFCTKLNTNLAVFEGSIALAGIIRHRHQWPIPAASFGGLNVDETATTKLLGVVFDKSMSFRNHLRSVAMRAAQRLGFLRKACRVLDISGRLTAYKGFVRPLMEYSPLAWGGAAPITCPNWTKSNVEPSPSTARECS